MTVLNLEGTDLNSSFYEIGIDNQIGDAGAQAIAEALKVNTTVAELNLGWNKMGVAGAQAIGEALKVNTAVTELYLYSNQIGDAGAQAIGEALKVNTTVTELKLDDNEIGDDGARAIGEALGFNTSLVKLSLDNPQIGDEGDQAINGGLLSNLRMLEFSPLSTPGVDVLDRNKKLKRARDGQARSLFAAIDDPSTLLYHGFDVFKDLSRSISRALFRLEIGSVKDSKCKTNKQTNKQKKTMELGDTCYSLRAVQAAERSKPGLLVSLPESLLQILLIVLLPVLFISVWASIPIVDTYGNIVPLLFVLLWHPIYLVTTAIMVQSIVLRSLYAPQWGAAFPFMLAVWGVDAALIFLFGWLTEWRAGAMRVMDFVSQVCVTGVFVLPAIGFYTLFLFKVKEIPLLLRPVAREGATIAPAWTSTDFEAARKDRAAQVRVLKIFAGLLAIGVISLSMYSFCMGFSIFAESAVNRSTRAGLLRSVFGIVLAIGVRILGLAGKRVAEAADRASNTGRPLFPGIVFAVELFVELFGKFLFISVTTWSSFAAWQVLSFVGELVSWPLKMTATYVALKRKIPGASSSRVRSYAKVDTEKAPGAQPGAGAGVAEADVEAHRRVHSFEFFLHFWAQRLGSLALLVLPLLWRSLPNSPQFEISALSTARYNIVVTFLLAQAAVELAQSVVILLLFKWIWNKEPMREGPRWIKATGSGPYLFWWCVHILSDIVIFKCRHEF